MPLQSSFVPFNEYQGCRQPRYISSCWAASPLPVTSRCQKQQILAPVKLCPLPRLVLCPPSPRPVPAWEWDWCPADRAGTCVLLPGAGTGGNYPGGHEEHLGFHVGSEATGQEFARGPRLEELQDTWRETEQLRTAQTGSWWRSSDTHDELSSALFPQGYRQWERNNILAGKGLQILTEWPGLERTKIIEFQTPLRSGNTFH